MFRYLKNLYQSVVNYFYRKKPILSVEQRNQFEHNLGDLKCKYKITYGRGTITLRPSGLEKIV